jgi:CDP-diacylglycerol--serine O-phosphatidyltransferase
MLPNIVTIISLCMGLSAIHFGFLGQWQRGVASVLIAGVLDGIDGRLARFLGSSTDFGAELDSLADFINFGVAPSLLVYFFSLHQFQGIGWGLCLFFSACMALRLARFNIQRHQPTSSGFSVGVPAPAGALLVFMPMMVTFVLDHTISPLFFAVTLIGVSLMLISRYPTFVFKKIALPIRWMGGFLIAVLMTIVGLLVAPWETLLVLCILYLLSLPISGYISYKPLKKKQYGTLSVMD